MLSGRCTRGCLGFSFINSLSRCSLFGRLWCFGADIRICPCFGVPSLTLENAYLGSSVTGNRLMILALWSQGPYEVPFGEPSEEMAAERGGRGQWQRSWPQSQGHRHWACVHAFLRQDSGLELGTSAGCAYAALRFGALALLQKLKLFSIA